MGCLNESRWLNGPQLEKANRHGWTVKCVEMMIHAANARSSRDHFSS